MFKARFQSAITGKVGQGSPHFLSFCCIPRSLTKFWHAAGGQNSGKVFATLTSPGTSNLQYTKDCVLGFPRETQLTRHNLYSWSLNNTGLNCAGPLLCGIFSIINTTVLHDPMLVDQRMQNLGYWEWTLVMCGFLTMWRFCTPNPWADQRSACTHKEGDVFQGTGSQDSWCCSVPQSCPTLQPHELQHVQASLFFTISWSLFKLMFMFTESVMPSNHHILCCPLLLLASISPSTWVFPRSWRFSSGGQSIGASASASALSMNIQGWFPLGWTGLISLQSKGLSRVFSSTTLQKHKFFSTQPSLWSTSHICAWLLEKP